MICKNLFIVKSIMNSFSPKLPKITQNYNELF